jgi:serine/threonine protein kinase
MYTIQATEEMKIANDIKKIDPEMKYSIYPYKMCYPTVKDIDIYMKEGFGKCAIDIPLDNQLVVEELIKMNALCFMQQKYGGKALYTMFSYSHQNKITANFVYSIYYKLINVFKGLELYHENSFVHLDIKPENIVLYDKSYIIDFGISVPLKSYKPGTHRFDEQSPFFIKKQYDYYPFDSNYIKRWKNIFNSKGDIVIDRDHIIDYWHGLKKREYIPKQYYMGEFFDDEFIQFSSLLEYEHIYEDIFNNLLKLNDDDKTMLKPSIRNHLLKQVDVFSLGITICQMTYYLTRRMLDIDGKVMKLGRYDHHPAISDKIVASLYQLGMKMMHIHPFKRLTITAALNEYRDILKTMPLEKTATTEKIFELIEKSSLGIDPYLMSGILSV